MIEEIAYTLAGMYSSDTARFSTITHYVNLDKGRHTLNAFTGFVPGACIGYIAGLIFGGTGLMEIGAFVGVVFNFSNEFPVKPGMTPAEIDEMYTKLRQGSTRKD